VNEEGFRALLASDGGGDKLPFFPQPVSSNSDRVKSSQTFIILFHKYDCVFYCNFVFLSGIGTAFAQIIHIDKIIQELSYGFT
jgi:hypothetical protein